MDYCKKGRQLFVEGTPYLKRKKRQNNGQDVLDQNGKAIYDFYPTIRVNTIIGLQGGQATNNNNAGQKNNNMQQQPQQGNFQQQQQPMQGGFQQPQQTGFGAPASPFQQPQVQGAGGPPFGG